jgi:hypothetical protein
MRHMLTEIFVQPNVAHTACCGRCYILWQHMLPVLSLTSAFTVAASVSELQ